MKSTVGKSGGMLPQEIKFGPFYSASAHEEVSNY